MFILGHKPKLKSFYFEISKAYIYPKHPGEAILFAFYVKRLIYDKRSAQCIGASPSDLTNHHTERAIKCI